MKYLCIRILGLGLGLGLVSQSMGQTFNFQMPITAPWFDTGIDIVSGQQLAITANGTVSFATGSAGVNADGIGSGYDGTQKLLDTVIPNTIHLSLIGKIGGTTGLGNGSPLPEGLPGRGVGFVGSTYEQTVPYSGRLFLGFNDTDSNFGDNSGNFSVQVQLVPEPNSFILLLSGLPILWLARKALGRCSSIGRFLVR